MPLRYQKETIIKMLGYQRSYIDDQDILSSKYHEYWSEPCKLGKGWGVRLTHQINGSSTRGWPFGYYPRPGLDPEAAGFLGVCYHARSGSHVLLLLLASKLSKVRSKLTAKENMSSTLSPGLSVRANDVRSTWRWKVVTETGWRDYLLSWMHTS
jgi:hypothetical protein